MLTDRPAPTGCTVTISASYPGQCVMPADLLDAPEITYNISYSDSGPDPNVQSLSNVRLVVYLPAALDPNLSSLNGGTYVASSHTVTWGIGSLGWGQSGSRSMKASVNYYATPGAVLRNIAQLEFDPWAVQASVDTPICHYAGPVIYADPNATGWNNGSSWDDAFTSLEDAVASANRYGPGAQIWLRKGIYRQGVALVPQSGISIYGGFAGDETSLDQRDPAANPTAISGDINDDSQAETFTMMSLDGVTDVTLDGITFTATLLSGISVQNAPDPNIVINNCTFGGNAGQYGGVHAYYAALTVKNCTFASNSVGISAENDSDIDVSGCVFSNNSLCGIELSSANADVYRCEIGPGNTGVSCSGYEAYLTECWIHGNTRGIMANGAGISLTQCTANQNTVALRAENWSVVSCDRTLISDNFQVGVSVTANNCYPSVNNCIVRSNGSHGIFLEGTNGTIDTVITNNWIVNNGGYGIYMYNVHAAPEIRNNTIASNAAGGIYRYEVNHDPAILNCIFWGNGSNSITDFAGRDFGNVTYSRTSVAHSGTGNTIYDPCFVASTSGDYHLKSLSACIDAGLTVDDCYWEPDIDHEERIFDGNYDGVAKVDMGADEFYRSRGDLNADELVNFLDYALLMNRWLNTCSAGNQWCNGTDINHSGQVNGADLYFIIRDWLWQAAEPHLPGCDMSLLPQQQSPQQSMMATSLESESISLASSACVATESMAVETATVESVPTAADFQSIIDFMYQVAQEDPSMATTVADMIQTLQAEMNAAYPNQ